MSFTLAAPHSGEGCGSAPKTMILTCPNCSASYTVAKGDVAATGRKVRCATCGHKWTAYPTDEEEATVAIAPPTPPRVPDLPPSPEPDPTPAEPEPPEPEENFPPVETFPPARRAATRRRGPPPALVWMGFAAVLALLALAGAIFRDRIVQMWPKTAALYAAAGVPVNGIGLLIDQVRLTPAVRNGQAVLGVSGRIRNEREVPTRAAALQITLFDRNGVALSQLVSRPVDVLPPLESRFFSILIKNPPPGVSGVSLTFVSHLPSAEGTDKAASGDATATHGPPASANPPPPTPASPASPGPAGPPSSGDAPKHD